VMGGTRYGGGVDWNRKQKRDRWGVKKCMGRPEGEWLRLDAAELRIVAEDLWRAAHRRLEAARELYAFGGRATDRPDQQKYLLSGIARCATCGGSHVAVTRDSKRAGERGRFYWCHFKHNRRGKVFPNPLLMLPEEPDPGLLH